MDLALFDLDNTLLLGDSDYLWGLYLCKVGAVDRNNYENQNNQFYKDYCEGKLDISKYLKFALQPFSENTKNQLTEWRESFIQETIIPLISAKAISLVKEHIDKNDTVAVASSTNHFIVQPIAKLFGIDNVIATDLEIINGEFTGKVNGIPSYGSNKCIRIKQWIATNAIKYQSSWFYSDSINDLSSLQWADHAIVVNGDDMLCKEAQRKRWKTIVIN